MSTVKANQWLNSDGTENYKCRAWVNFNGTGTVAIRASGNVSSITDNGTGDYTVNFTTAMPDANYATEQIALISGQVASFTGTNFSRTTTSNRLGALAGNTGIAGAAWVLIDSAEVSVSIFR